MLAVGRGVSAFLGLATLAGGLAFLSRCSPLTDDAKAVVSNALTNGDVVMLARPSAFLFTADLRCFANGVQQVPLVIRYATQGHSNPMSFNLDPVRAIETVYAVDMQQPHSAYQGQSNTCFEERITSAFKVHETGTLLDPNTEYFGLNAYPGYHIVLGTVHVNSVEFVNEYAANELEGGAKRRSYHVSFSVDQIKPTGSGSLPSGFSVTCIAAKDPVQNQWVMDSCS